jgi:hypothetical protein
VERRSGHIKRSLKVTQQLRLTFKLQHASYISREPLTLCSFSQDLDLSPVEAVGCVLRSTAAGDVECGMLWSWGRGIGDVLDFQFALNMDILPYLQRAVCNTNIEVCSCFVMDSIAAQLACSQLIDRWSYMLRTSQSQSRLP